MPRVRLSTTVDPVLIDAARRPRPGKIDAALLDEALSASLASHRAAEIDVAYGAYDQQPLNQPDEWDDLAPAARRRCIVTDTPGRGEVWWCELADIGRRPVVAHSRDATVPRLRRALVAPCTTTIRGLAREVVLEPEADPIPWPAAVKLDSVESVSIAMLVERLGRLSDHRMRAVCAALNVAVACDFGGAI